VPAPSPSRQESERKTHCEPGGETGLIRHFIRPVSYTFPFTVRIIYTEANVNLDDREYKRCNELSVCDTKRTLFVEDTMESMRNQCRQVTMTSHKFALECKRLEKQSCGGI